MVPLKNHINSFKVLNSQIESYQVLFEKQFARKWEKYDHPKWNYDDYNEIIYS